MSGITVSTGGGEIAPLVGARFESLGLADLRRFRFKGKAQPGQTFAGNFVECVFEDVELDSINFRVCDWKDCRLYATLFIDCDLGEASLITNSFESCRFIRCRFPNTGISDCTFRDCIFDNCDLSNIVMKSNRLERCAFLRCKTSNRIIESSLLLDTRWTEMNLEVGIVLGNFGVRSADLESCTLFLKTDNRDLKELSWSELEDIDSERSFSPIERFRVAFFKTGSADGDANAFENALNPRNWTSDAIIEASFGALLTNFAQFLLALYATNRLPIYGLLRFHTHNFDLLDWLSGNPELSYLYQVAAGVHLSLTREVDAFASEVQAIADGFTQLSQRRLLIEAEGPLHPDYYIALLNELEISKAKVDWVRPRNSPVELAISFFDYATLISLVAVVLGTRMKFELLKINAIDWAKSDKSKRKRMDSDKTQELISFRSGFSLERPSEFQINVRTLLPRSLLADLHLSFNIALLKKTRGILINLLQPRAEH